MFIGIFITFVAFVLKTINSANNTSNINNLFAKVIAKSPVQIQKNKCQLNPALSFLSSDLLSNINSTLHESPQSESLSMCRDSRVDTSCCTQATVDLLYNQFTVNDLKEKLQIYSKNMGLYYLVIKEHLRNLNVGFNVDNTKANTIVSDYLNFTNIFANISQIIARESLKYKWNAYCNYICNSDYNNLCSVYNVTYSYNDTIYFDLEYNCAIDSVSSEYIKNLVKSYLNNYKNMNSSLSSIYKGMTTISNNMYLFSSQSGTNNTMYNLLANSFNDGLAVSQSIAKPPICDSSGNNVNCTTILSKFCSIFECLDNSVMQFYDDSTERQSFIISKYSFTNFVTNNNTNKFGKFDKDVEDFINTSLVFVSGEKLQSVSRFWYLLSLLVIFYL